jgi:hypothetical protein
MTRIWESSTTAIEATHGRERHERQVGPVELGLVVGPLRDLRPDDRVGRASRRTPLRVEAGLGDPGRQRVDVHGALAGRPQRAQGVEALVGPLAGEVGGDHVTDRQAGGALEDRDRADGRVLGEHVEHRLGECRRHADAQVEHGHRPQVVDCRV